MREWRSVVKSGEGQSARFSTLSTHPIRGAPGKIGGSISSHELCTPRILLFYHLHKHYSLHASDRQAGQHHNSWGALEQHSSVIKGLGKTVFPPGSPSGHRPFWITGGAALYPGFRGELNE